ncbi:hypothetical protein [Candidatus Nanohalococcus occultus]|uniref:hypothetical protein n=1 Tax=Candidatus Nanohalococcus occultus TaxID=2978047 RepID=UPI0039E15E03
MGMKGFYFSFDSLLALGILTASLLLVAQYSNVQNTGFEANTVDYRGAGTAGKDAMKLGSQQSFSAFNESYRQELVDQTVMEESDLDRTILDGMTLLWAARNTSYTREVAEKYFDRKIPEKYEYRIQVNESGRGDILYRTSEMPEDAAAVASISRLVSGHRIDRPSEGFQARARATEVRKNTTQIVSLPAMGYANENGKLEVDKKFNITNPDEIYNAVMYLNIEYNGDTIVEQFKLNGVQKKNDYSIIHDYQDDTALIKFNLTDAVQPGENSVYIRFKGDASQSQPTDLQPGGMLRVKYRKDKVRIPDSRLRHERIYMENLTAETPGNGQSGIFKVESFEIPENAEFINATINLEARGLDSGNCGYDGGWFGPYYDWDFKTIFNGQTLEQSCASGSLSRTYQLDSSDVRKGTNVFTVYLESLGDTFWGGETVSLYSDYESDDSSYIDVYYNVSDEQLRFGQIQVTAAEEMGGGIEEPKVYSKEFEYTDLASTEVYIAQRYSNTVHLEVDNGSGYTNIFTSPEVRASPTRLTVDPSYFNLEGENRIRMYDSGPDIVKFYPESTFKWTVWVPSQVGYGELYSNQSAAVQDAQNRLEDTLGPFVDATGISTSQVSTGDQPYIWGPASLKLVVWDE